MHLCSQLALASVPCLYFYITSLVWIWFQEQGEEPLKLGLVSFTL